MYKIRKMDINDYPQIINLWKNTPGVGLNENDDSKISIKGTSKNDDIFHSSKNSRLNIQYFIEYFPVWQSISNNRLFYCC